MRSHTNSLFSASNAAKREAQVLVWCCACIISIYAYAYPCMDAWHTGVLGVGRELRFTVGEYIGDSEGIDKFWIVKSAFKGGVIGWDFRL
jgi:hypothetical protein